MDHRKTVEEIYMDVSRASIPKREIMGEFSRAVESTTKNSGFLPVFYMSWISAPTRCIKFFFPETRNTLHCWQTWQHVWSLTPAVPNHETCRAGYYANLGGYSGCGANLSILQVDLCINHIANEHLDGISAKYRICWICNGVNFMTF